MSHNKAGMLLSVVAIVISLVLLNSQAFGAKTPQKGDVLPDIAIPVPHSDADKEYLGLKGGAFFKVPRIKARVMIIDIDSVRQLPGFMSVASATGRPSAIICRAGAYDFNPRLKVVPGRRTAITPFCFIASIPSSETATR